MRALEAFRAAGPREPRFSAMRASEAFRAAGPREPRFSAMRALEAFDDGRDAHSVADAHRAQPVSGILALQFVQQCRDQTRATGTKWMAQSNRPAAVVHLLHVGAGLVLPRQHHRREGLVDFKEID